MAFAVGDVEPSLKPKFCQTQRGASVEVDDFFFDESAADEIFAAEKENGIFLIFIFLSDSRCRKESSPNRVEKIKL